MKFSKKTYLCEKTILLVFIKKNVRLLLVFWSILYFVSLQNIYATQSDKKVEKMYLECQSYVPAFAPQTSKMDSDQISVQDSNYYTIQICSMYRRINDSFFQGNYKIHIIQMGELYRYIFSSYSSLLKAQKDLIWIRRIYPDAYIRKYKDGKLGLAININTITTLPYDE